MLSDGVQRSATSSIINTIFYALIIYGNISLLFPRFYQRKKYLVYILLAIVLLLIAGLGRGYVTEFAQTNFFNRPSRVLTTKIHVGFFISGLMVFTLSFIFRLAIAYFEVRQKAEETLLLKSQFELSLLKSQVQPHFLFNTLNNIYYEAYRESPRAALLIERLADIMRYFVDDTNKDLLPISKEVQFIENYIGLERIRIRHEVEINFIKDYDPNTLIPSMLLMTFVENIFKHGIDKSSLGNKVDISLVQKADRLTYSTINKIQSDKSSTKSGGLGIQNLRKRLEIIYGSNFKMKTEEVDGYYVAELEIPIE